MIPWLDLQQQNKNVVGMCVCAHTVMRTFTECLLQLLCSSVCQYTYKWRMAKWIFIKFNTGEFSKKKSSHFKFFWQWTILIVTLHKIYPCFCTHIHKHSCPITTRIDYWHSCSAYVQFILCIAKVFQVWKIKQDLVSLPLECGTGWLGIWFPTFYSLVVPPSRVIRTSKHWEPNIQRCGIKTQKNLQAKSDFFILTFRHRASSI